VLGRLFLRDRDRQPAFRRRAEEGGDHHRLGLVARVVGGVHRIARIDQRLPGSELALDAILGEDEDEVPFRDPDENGPGIGVPGEGRALAGS
jgi:hypothetical protein